MKNSDVTVIVTFYERIRHLKLCLESLRSASHDFDEVVVTDDGSVEETVDRVKRMIEHYDFPVKHVWQPKQGFRAAAARNNGIKNSGGAYLIFLDCDFVVMPDTVREHLRRRKAKRFVAGHCKYLDKNQSEALLESGISSYMADDLYKSLPAGEINEGHRRFIKRTLLMRLGLTRYSKQSLGGHLSIHRKDIESVNGYDENFVGWGGEDEDLGIRLVKAGVFGRSAIRSARVLHVWHPKELGEKHWCQGSNVGYFTNRQRPVFCENGLVKIGAGRGPIVMNHAEPAGRPTDVTKGLR
jgi:glycosyltransferase involved in cell wall biosynthesis